MVKGQGPIRDFDNLREWRTLLVYITSVVTFCCPDGCQGGRTEPVEDNRSSETIIALASCVVSDSRYISGKAITPMSDCESYLVITGCGSGENPTVNILQGNLSAFGIRPALDRRPSDFGFLVFNPAGER